MPGPIIAIPRRMNYGRPSVTRIGPWPQGVMLQYDPQQIGNNALQYASNVDVLPNGQLRQRPPFQVIQTAYNGDATIVAALNALSSGGDWILDGAYPIKIAGTWSLVAVSHSVATGYICFTNLSSGTLIAKWQITSTNLVFYNGRVYGLALPNSTAVTAGQIFSFTMGDPTIAPVAGQTFPAASRSPVTTGAFPCQLAIIKDRLYIFNYVSRRFMNTSISSQVPDLTTNCNMVTFSKTGDPNTISGDPDAGFFKLSNSVATSNSDHVTAITAIRNSIYIFTANTTWLLSLPSSGLPTSGTLSIISDRVGAYDGNCVATYDNKIFVAGAAGVYEILNGTFTDIGYVLGPRVNIAGSYVGGVDYLSLSIVGDKLWLGIQMPNDSTGFLPNLNPPGALGPPPQDPFFIYNLKSRAWSSYRIPQLSDGTQYYGTHPYQSTFFCSYKAIPVIGGGPFNPGELVRGPGGVANSSVSAGTLLQDAGTGYIYFMPEYDPDAMGGNILTSLGTQWADLLDPSGSYQNVKMTIWTQDTDGATVETASWKRYYAAVANIYAPIQLKAGFLAQTVTIGIADHNLNFISSANVSLGTQVNRQYYSVKAHISLRARHAQFRLQIQTQNNGPFSLLNLDVLAKVKQEIQSLQVGN